MITSSIRRFAVTPVLALAAVSFGVSPASSQDPLPLTLENIFEVGAGGARDVALSPDGETVAVVASGPAGSGIYRIGVSPGSEAEYWIAGSSPAWSRDGSALTYVDGGRIWTIGASDTEGRAVTPSLEGARAPVFSDDGDWIAFMASESGTQDVWVVSAGGGEPRQLTQGAMSVDDNRFGPGWSPDGSRIAYVGNRADYWSDDVWVVDVESGESRQVSEGLMALSNAPAWSPDGESILIAASDKDDMWYLDIADLYLVDPAGGPARKVEMQVHVTGYRYQPIWAPDGNSIYFAYQQRGEHALWVVPSQGGVATRVTHLGGVQRAFSMDAAGESLAFVQQSSVTGPDVWLIPTAGGPERQLTSFARAFADLAPPVEVSYRSYDGLYMQGFLYGAPTGGSAEVCPALVQVHGGGTNSYLNGLNLVEQYLANRGYVVLAINYRGGSGFGRGFQALADEDWLNGQARDPGSAADFLRGLPGVNGDVGIYGYSYGGMQTMAAITRTPDKFDAAVPMAGIYSEARTFPEMDRLGQVFARDGHGGLPDERPEIYEKSETLARLDRIAVPLLVMHGDLDVRAPFSNFELAVAELERLGKDYEVRTYPEGHGFRDQSNRVDMYRALEDFFAEHLTGCRVSG